MQVEEKAKRYNSDKVRHSLVPTEFISMLAEVFEAGAKKYAAHNWKKSLNTSDHDKFIEDRLDSMLRHIHDYRMGIWLDPETKCSHLVQVAWNALVIVWYVMKQDKNTVIDKYPKLNPIDFHREASKSVGAAGVMGYTNAPLDRYNYDSSTWSSL